MLFMHVYPSSILYIRFLDAPSSIVLQSSIQNGRKWKICIRFLGRFEHTKTPTLHTSTPKKAAKKLNTKLRWDETVRALWTSCPTTQRCLPEKRRFFFFPDFCSVAGFCTRFFLFFFCGIFVLRFSKWVRSGKPKQITAWGTSGDSRQGNSSGTEQIPMT